MKAREQDTSEPEIGDVPEGWSSATVRDITDLIQYGVSIKANVNNDGKGIPIVRMSNIRDGKLDLSDLKYVPRSTGLDSVRLARGDVLFNRTNSPELVGKAAVVDVDSEFIFASYLIRLRALRDTVEPQFLCWWINSPWGRRWAAFTRTDGVSQSNINGSKLAAMQVPLPPVAEQRRIVAKVEELVGHANKARERLARVPLILSQFRQAVLAAACSGRLTEDWRAGRTLTAERIREEVARVRREAGRKNPAPPTEEFELTLM